MKKMSAYKLMLSIYLAFVLSTCTVNKAVSILERKILKIGKMTPLAKDTNIPTIKMGILPVE